MREAIVDLHNTQFTSLITREYQGHTFTFREDGYFNMTKAAQHYGKYIGDFWKLNETKEYLDAMVVTTGIPLEILKQARCGGKGADAGTWAHPKLAVFFARWLDVRFAVWCDLMVDEILRGRVEVQPVAAPLTPDRTVEEPVRKSLTSGVFESKRVERHRFGLWEFLHRH